MTFHSNSTYIIHDLSFSYFLWTSYISYSMYKLFVLGEGDLSFWTCAQSQLLYIAIKYVQIKYSLAIRVFQPRPQLRLDDIYFVKTAVVAYRTLRQIKFSELCQKAREVAIEISSQAYPDILLKLKQFQVGSINHN